MKTDFWRRLRQPARARRLDALLLVLSGVAWFSLFQSRPLVIETRCATHSSPCVREEVNPLDRPVVGWESPGADSASFGTQNAAGYLAGLAPPLWSAALAFAGKLTPQAALIAAGIDLLIFAETAVLNGLAMEAARLAIQRPRPFVYANPHGHGSVPANYTSFYSGHTSFAAAAGASLVFALAGRGAPSFVLLGSGMVAAGLAILTGILRVLSGRHFPTDVAFGLLAGTLAAWGDALLHRDAPRIRK